MLIERLETVATIIGGFTCSKFERESASKELDEIIKSLGHDGYVKTTSGIWFERTNYMIPVVTPPAED